MYCYSEISYFREIYLIFTFSEGSGSHQMYQGDLLAQLQELVVLVVVVGPFVCACVTISSCLALEYLVDPMNLVWVLWEEGLATRLVVDQMDPMNQTLIK